MQSVSSLPFDSKVCADSVSRNLLKSGAEEEDNCGKFTNSRAKARSHFPSEITATTQE
jgi:hypothetical protein